MTAISGVNGATTGTPPQITDTSGLPPILAQKVQSGEMTLEEAQAKAAEFKAHPHHGGHHHCSKGQNTVGLNGQPPPGAGEKINTPS